MARGGCSWRQRRPVSSASVTRQASRPTGSTTTTRDWLSEEIPPRGSPEHPYSHQKAEVERVLGEVLLRHPSTVAYAFRPCIVAGPEARTMLEEIPYYRLSEAMPDAVARLLVARYRC